MLVLIFSTQNAIDFAKQPQRWNGFMIRLSFCTTCMNRLYQLRETLPHNLAEIQKFKNVNLCLVNFNSQDGLHEYIINNFQEQIQHGTLRYFYTKEPSYFHCSIAKNLAHRLGDGEILYNLDGDNFISEVNIRKIMDVFNKESHIFLHDRKYNKKISMIDLLGPNGSIGRIAMKSYDFHKLGGYDEALLGASVHDIDLIKRLKKIDLKKINTNTQVKPAILNDKKTTLSNQPIKMPYFFYEYYNKYLLLLRNLLRRPVNKNGMKKFRGELNLEKYVEL